MDELRNRGLHANFIFAGLVAPVDIYRYTSLMNVLVHLSQREGLPRAVVSMVRRFMTPFS